MILILNAEKVLYQNSAFFIDKQIFFKKKICCFMNNGLKFSATQVYLGSIPKLFSLRDFNSIWNQGYNENITIILISFVLNRTSYYKHARLKIQECFT